MNVRIFWVCAMECMCTQTIPRFILSSKRVFCLFLQVCLKRKSRQTCKNWQSGSADTEPCHLQRGQDTSPLLVQWRLEERKQWIPGTPHTTSFSPAQNMLRRQLTWPHGADLVTKLLGSAEDLYWTAGFVASTGLKFWTAPLSITKEEEEVGMESEPMSAPREKSSCLENSPQRRIKHMTLHQARQWAQRTINELF